MQIDAAIAAIIAIAAIAATVIAAIAAIFGFLCQSIPPEFLQSFLCKIRAVQAKNSKCKFWGKFHKLQIMPLLCNGLKKWISKKLEMLLQLAALFSKTRLKFCNNVFKKN